MNTISFFTVKMEIDINRKTRLERAFRIAVDTESYDVFYQPKVCLSSRKMIGVEALVRWQKAGKDIISAGEFISIAEEIGLIHQIGKTIVRKACEHQQQWYHLGISLPIAINLSAKQFMDRNMHTEIINIVSDHNLPSHLFHFEVTENSLMKDINTGISIIKGLRDAGFRIAIDDFGTGYSSLNYLKSLPFDYLKIDRHFLNGVPKNTADNAIVSTIITLAKSMNAKVIAEGVETEDQIHFLQNLNCDEIQGYYISQAMSFKQITTLLTYDHLSK